MQPFIRRRKTRESGAKWLHAWHACGPYKRVAVSAHDRYETIFLPFLRRACVRGFFPRWRRMLGRGAAARGGGLRFDPGGAVSFRGGDWDAGGGEYRRVAAARAGGEPGDARDVSRARPA